MAYMIYLGLGIILLSTCMIEGSLLIGGLGIIVGCLLAVPGIVKENRDAQGE